jgi:hypothetical protein
VALFWLAAAQQAAVLVQQPETVLRWNGVACLVVAFAAGAAVLHPWWDRRFRLSFGAG